MSTRSLTGVDMTAGLTVPSYGRRVLVCFDVQSQRCAIVSDTWMTLTKLQVDCIALALSLHIVHGGPVSRGRGAISATDLKVDVA